VLGLKAEMCHCLSAAAKTKLIAGIAGERGFREWWSSEEERCREECGMGTVESMCAWRGMLSYAVAFCA
jgi:hypothetical protein